MNEKPQFEQWITMENGPIVSENKCLAIATGQESWQRYTPGTKATPSSSGSFIPFK